MTADPGFDTTASAPPLRRAAEYAVGRARVWNRLDGILADGDLGTALAAAAGVVLHCLDEGPTPAADLYKRIGAGVSVAAGGTSGRLMSAAFDQVSLEIARDGSLGPVEVLAIVEEAIAGAGDSARGEKTVLDAIAGARDALAREPGPRDLASSLRRAADGAATGAALTATMTGRRGRAAASGESGAGVVDAGAWAFAELLSQMASAAAGEPATVTDGASRSDGADAAAGCLQLLGRHDLIVRDAIRALVTARPDQLVMEDEPLVIARAAVRAGIVGLVSGGGSGHEPLHAGFVGRGMLAAAAPGQVFASPSLGQVRRAIELADAGAGVLLVVKNYTGDVATFAEAARSSEAAGRRVRSVVLRDDVGSPAGLEAIGRRGTAGAIFVERIAGAAADAGEDLETVAGLAREVASASRSIAFSYGPIAKPDGTRIHELALGELEFGAGIHGEVGGAIHLRPSPEEILERVAEALVGVELIGRDLILLVSGLGGTSRLEQLAFSSRLVEQIEGRGARVAELVAEPLITALDMRGIVAAVLPLREDWLERWRSPIDTSALAW